MKKIAALGLVVGLLGPGVWVLPTGATAKKPAAHAAYALKGKKCRVDFIKRTERHNVGGKQRRYVACVYKKPVADPPTVVTVTSSENPAVVGDSVTYTVVVDHILGPTTGKLELWDGATQLTKCSIPQTPTAPNGSAEIAGQCTEVAQVSGYSPISGIFTGDQVYAQAAGTLLETISVPAPTTTTQPAPDTATTLPADTTTTLAPETTTTVPETTTTIPDTTTSTTTTTVPVTTTTTPPTLIDEATTVTGVRALDIGGGNLELSATVTPEPSVTIGSDGGTVTFSDVDQTLCVASAGIGGSWRCIISAPNPLPNPTDLTASYGGITFGAGTSLVTTFGTSSGVGTGINGI